MNSTLDLLKLALKESDKEILNHFLQVCKDNRLFQRKDCNSDNIVSLINSLLDGENGYDNAFLILEVFIHQCSSNLLGRHLLHWLQQCQKNLQFHNESLTVYPVLRSLIIYSSNFPDIKKQVSFNVIPKLLDYLFKFSNDSKMKISFILCLEEILVQYGRSCTKWKARMEKFLLSLLESSSDIAHISARCFLKLVSIGISNPSVDSYKEEWSKKQHFLLCALHSNLDNLFKNIIEVEGTNKNTFVQDFKGYIPEIKEESQLKCVQRLTTQFINLTEFLRVLLLNEFLAAKRIRPNVILGVACRGLAVTCATLEANISNDSIMLSTQIPTIHRACITLIEALIKSCRRNLIPHGKLICKLMTQTLKWTTAKDNVYGQNKPYGSLRTEVYNCFSSWLTISRIASSVEHYINDIIALILLDIHSEPPLMTLTIPTKRLKGKVGKKERKMNKQVTDEQSNLSVVIINNVANKEVCEAALNFLPCLLEASFSMLSPKIHKQLQEQVINELLLTQTALSAHLELPIPYSDKLCRLALYKALLALCNNHHPEFTAPCNFALPIFSQGINDNSLLISRFCGQAVGNIEKMLYPTGSMLQFPSVIHNEITSTIQPFSIDNRTKCPENNVCNKDDSIALENISGLFENKLSETCSNDENVNMRDKNKEITSHVNVVQEVEHSMNMILTPQKILKNRPNDKVSQTSIENTPCMKDLSENVVLEVDLEHQVFLEDKKNNSDKRNGDKVETKKRISDDVIDSFPIEKKKKTENSLTSRHGIDEENALEVEMLSSFVDLVE